jgi:hypothetical protein
MAERTEIQKLLKLPAKVKLGEGEYDIKPLPLQYSLPWRDKVFNLFISSTQYSKITSDDTAAFNEAMKSVMVTSPDMIIDLFFEYARDLKRDDVLKVADSNQLLEAWGKIIEFESPFLGSLLKTVNLLKTR